MDKKIVNLIDEIYSKFFKNYTINLGTVYDKILLDFNYQKEKGFENIDGIIALIFYRISRLILNELGEDVLRLRQESKMATTSYISPYSKIDCPIGLFGKDIFIESQFNICKHVDIYNNVTLADKMSGYGDKNIHNIKSNTIIKSDVKIVGADVGEGVLIGENCIIREDIKDNTIVELISDFQVKKIKNKTYLPSQELLVYGVVPKFKNTLVIYGDGFYNPKVKLVVKNNNLSYGISYWDKNKIIIKLDYQEIKVFDKTTLVIFSNGQRISLINNLGVKKILKNLKN